MNRSNRLEHLVKQYENTLFRAALAILGDWAGAEDAVQDTFLRYLEKRPQFADENHEKAWLLRVTANNCKSRLRTAARHPLDQLPDDFPVETPQESGVPEAVFSLPPRERTAVHLYYYEGYATEEIAKITGQRPGTVRSHLSRARDKLRELLKGDFL